MDTMHGVAQFLDEAGGYVVLVVAEQSVQAQMLLGYKSLETPIMIGHICSQVHARGPRVNGTFADVCRFPPSIGATVAYAGLAHVFHWKRRALYTWEMAAA